MNDGDGDGVRGLSIPYIIYPIAIETSIASTLALVGGNTSHRIPPFEFYLGTLDDSAFCD